MNKKYEELIPRFSHILNYKNNRTNSKLKQFLA